MSRKFRISASTAVDALIASRDLTIRSTCMLMFQTGPTPWKKKPRRSTGPRDTPRGRGWAMIVTISSAGSETTARGCPSARSSRCTPASRGAWHPGFLRWPKRNAGYASSKRGWRSTGSRRSGIRALDAHRADRDEDLQEVAVGEVDQKAQKRGGHEGDTVAQKIVRVPTGEDQEAHPAQGRGNR